MIPRRLRDGLDEEMRDHIERAAQDLVDRGVPPTEARLAAHRAFGSVALAREDTRAVWVPVWLEQALQDARYTLRSLARAPIFTVTSIASLAIGMAAATTVFGVADNLLVQPAPGVRDASRVVDVARTTNGSGFGTISYPAFTYLRDTSRSLESLAATTMDPIPLNLSDGEATNGYSSARCRRRSSMRWGSARRSDASSRRPRTSRRMRRRSLS